MKRLFLTILFLYAVSLGCIAQQRTATLSHNGKLTVFNSERCIPEAYDAAVDGDTIYLSSGDWAGTTLQTNGNFTIRKKISFIGNGRSTLLDGFLWLDLEEYNDKRLTATLFDGVSVGMLRIHHGVSNLEIKNSRIYSLIIRPESKNDSIDFKIQRCETKAMLDFWYGQMKGSFENSKVVVESYDEDLNIDFYNCNIDLDGAASTFSGHVSSSIIFGKSYEMRPKLLENCLYQWSEVIHNAEWEELEKSEYINCYELPYTSESDVILDKNQNYVGPDLLASGYLGTDGTQVGIYGGDNVPYTEYPSLRCLDTDRSEIHFDGYKEINNKLYFTGSDENRIIGLRVIYNNEEIGYIPVTYTEEDGLSAKVSLSDDVLPRIDSDVNKVNLDSQAQELWFDIDPEEVYGIQPMTESGWGVFTTVQNPIAGRYASKVQYVYSGELIELEKRTGLHFHAICFDVPFDTVSRIKLSQAARVEFYRKESGNTLNMTHSFDYSYEPNSEFEVELAGGRYYGIVYDMPTDDKNPESVLTMQIGETRPEPPHMYYDGRYLHMYTDSDKYDIWFEIGSSNNMRGVFQGGSIDVDGQLGMAIARAVSHDGTVESDPVAIEIVGYGNETTAVTSVPGFLESCFEWNGGRMTGKRFSVAGPLDASDYEWLNTHTSAYHLDLSEVTGDSIPDGALAPYWVKSIVLPSDMEILSGKIFKTSGAPFYTNVTLCALKWTSSNPMPEGMLDSLGNRGMLLYVDNESLARNVSDHEHNLVVAGVADSFKLNHGSHFYCPEEFIAKEASYYRYNDKETGIDGECAGWETIVVPYDVQEVEHAKGILTPFGVHPEEERLRYWLYAPTTSGWERATSIRANEPYLIAMPNNEVYYNPFNVGGNVWFKATNAFVSVTPDEISRDFTGGRKLVGVYQGIASAEDRFGINHDIVEVGGVTYRPGSVFISQVDKGISPASPFEAYMLGGATTRAMEIFTSSEVEAVLADMEMKVWTENGGIRIQAGFSAHVDVFDMTGRRVAVADVKAGEVCHVDGLAPGIYIASNRKVLLK